MIKTFFKSNQDYYAEDLNRIVSFLRTTGVCGEISDCLKVTKTTGTTVSIADGVGWVGGCGIEASESNTTLTLPTTAGTYSIIMELDKSGDVVNDISFAYESGQTVGNHVLAWVTVVNNTISTVTDKRVHSQFNGVTQVASIYPEWIAGNNIIFSDKAVEYKLTGSVFTEIKGYNINNNGSVRVSVKFGPFWGPTGSPKTNLDTSSTATLQIKLDGVVKGTPTAVGQVLTYEADITVTAGSVLTIEGKSSNADADHRSVGILKVDFGINRLSDTISAI